MIKVLFICHGNICRSPMAEMVFKQMLREAGKTDEVEVCSMATSTEEIGNDVHPGTKKVLKKHGIPCEKRHAVQITKKDFEVADYIICMDEYNVRNLEWRLGEDLWGKVSLLLDYSNPHGDIADPWYTGDFDITYNDVKRGCDGLLAHILKELK